MRQDLFNWALTEGPARAGKRRQRLCATMAKGYPTPRDADGTLPNLEGLVAEGTCIICKRRPSGEAGGVCATCREALRSP